MNALEQLQDYEFHDYKHLEDHVVTVVGLQVGACEAEKEKVSRKFYFFPYIYSPKG